MEKVEIEYREALETRLKTCPLELAEYIRKRLLTQRKKPIKDNDWMAPTRYCGFNWRKSIEGYDFWKAVSERRWEDANEAFLNNKKYADNKSEEYIKWLEKKIELCSEDKHLQREHWAFCKAYEKFMSL